MAEILVTGGAGFIGSHTCKALRRAGFDPICYDNLTRGNAEAVKWGPLEIGELVDGSHLMETLAHYRPAAVIHFAALAYVGELTKVRWPTIATTLVEPLRCWTPCRNAVSAKWCFP